jgi:hypothetical protein
MYAISQVLIRICKKTRIKIKKIGREKEKLIIIGLSLPNLLLYITSWFKLLQL